ncbi:MAG TPA: LEA type 2 family protein [Steroidobacteraceae bacterium]|nr:LEA type 2 family protein [Steroidobacteraceae bacterium]
MNRWLSAPRWPAAAALWTVLLCGCATLLPKLEAPRLTLLAVTLDALGPTQQHLGLRLHAENPNARAIAVEAIEVTVELSGERVAQGATTAAFSLPAQGATDFDVDVTADLNEALRLVAAAMGHHSVDYRLYGTAHLRGGLLSSLPFDQRGRVRL